MKKCLELVVFLVLLGMSAVSNAEGFTCTIQCKDKTGVLKEVTAVVNASSRDKAVNSLIGFIDLSHSKAAEICKSENYEGLLIQKGKETVDCK